MRITPENIGSDLPSDTILVFGSNEAGIHGAGVARLAYDSYGARLNQGFGLMAQSFGIPTKDWEINQLSLSAIEHYVESFIRFVKIPRNIKWKFYVTRIGCGLAGYTVPQIAPMFKECVHIRNVWLPQDFLDFYESQNQVEQFLTSKKLI